MVYYIAYVMNSVLDVKSWHMYKLITVELVFGLPLCVHCYAFIIP